VFAGIWLIGYLAAIQRQAVNPPQAAAKPAEPTAADKRILVAVIGAKTLKSAMRDPESFKIEQVLSMPDGICFTYRAHNGFGGVNLGHASMNAKTGKLIASDQDGFATAWNKLCGGKSGEDLTTAVRWSM
jgi:hypothetical protein